MIEVLLGVLAIVVASLLIGTLACRLCGVHRWTWVSGPVGLSLMMLYGLPSLHAPGRMGFAAVLTLVLAAGGVGAMGREADLRPPAWAPLALLPTLLLAGIPFAANARVGTLGVGFNNDMAAHLLLADGLRSASVASVNTILNYYPLGPHAVAAFTAAGLGIPTDLAFAAFTVALPLLAAGLAVELLAPLRLPARILGATVTALPYLAASYFAQGAFKELMAILLTLGVVAAIPLARSSPDVRRFIPLGLLLAGMVSAYSYPGLIWPVATLGIWAVAAAIPRLRRRDWRGVAGRVREALPALALGGAATVVVLLPQAPRIKHFVDWNARVGVRKEDLGNLAGPISPGEALGVWLNPDFRFDPVHTLPNTLWLVLVVAGLVFSLVWWVRRGDLAAPAALVAGALVWLASDRSQSPYVVAKALVIVSPFVVLLISGALLAPRPAGAALLRRVGPAVVGVAIAGAVLWSSVGALRAAQVGARDHQQDLAALSPQLQGQPTLFLGIDDFVGWELDGVPVTQPLLGVLNLALRPEKNWAYGQGFDIDSFAPDVLDTFTYVVTPRDASASRMPPNFVKVAARGPFDVYRRTGPTAPRSILAEVGAGAAVLDCSTAAGRALAKSGGTAAIAAPTVAVPLTAVPSGGTVRTALPLTPGTWDLTVRYVSTRPVTVRAPGLVTRLPAAIERPGPGWPAGALTVRAAGKVPVTLTADDPLLAPSTTPVAGLTALLATLRTPERIVPLARACGKAVDWYRPAS